MLKLNKILIVIEPGNENQPALEKGVQLARRSGSELDLLVADFSPYLEDGYYFDLDQARQLRQQHIEENLMQLEILTQPLRDEGLKVSISAKWRNPPFEQITSHIAETAIDVAEVHTSPPQNRPSLFIE